MCVCVCARARLVRVWIQPWSHLRSRLVTQKRCRMSQEEGCACTRWSALTECTARNARLMPCRETQHPAYLEVEEEESCGIDGYVGKAPAHLVGWEAKELCRHAPRNVRREQVACVRVNLRCTQGTGTALHYARPRYGQKRLGLAHQALRCTDDSNGRSALLSARCARCQQRLLR